MLHEFSMIRVLCKVWIKLVHIILRHFVRLLFSSVPQFLIPSKIILDYSITWRTRPYIDINRQPRQSQTESTFQKCQNTPLISCGVERSFWLSRFPLHSSKTTDIRVRNGDYCQSPNIFQRNSFLFSRRIKRIWFF